MHTIGNIASSYLPTWPQNIGRIKNELNFFKYIVAIVRALNTCKPDYLTLLLLISLMERQGDQSAEEIIQSTTRTCEEEGCSQVAKFYLLDDIECLSRWCKTHSVVDGRTCGTWSMPTALHHEATAKEKEIFS